MEGLIALAILMIIIIVIIINCIKIVPQAHAMVIERLGGYLTTWSVGIHFKVPFIDRIAKKVILKEQVVDFPPQPVITKDNVTMQIDTVVYFQITDPKLYAYGVENPIMAIENLTATTLRNIIGNKLFVANIGDSRLYVVGQNMRQITRDHSLVDEMVRLGEINADEARVHPDKNIITRAVGTSDHVEADFFEVEITADDTILLCTDGLTNMVRDDEILDIIKKYDNAQAATMQLVKEANANGGRDNITVMIIKPF